ncbi:TPA: hypothetical protein NGU80_003653 [Vibrio parahaemolyticus]|nr:hypothetical protein [Vibrio parahaemolyticus]HCG9871346.1 hypothetical protein [Vibrio parahaemolyticus]
MKKKKSKFAAHPPVASDINEANAQVVAEKDNLSATHSIDRLSGTGQ